MKESHIENPPPAILATSMFEPSSGSAFVFISLAAAPMDLPSLSVSAPTLLSCPVLKTIVMRLNGLGLIAKFRLGSLSSF